jgi:sugar lactone lactonase YvrE
VDVFDDRRCELGEGAFWHPLRGQFFWFDITGFRLLTREDGAAREWGLGEHVSAAGWIDRDRLLIASETGLWRFDLLTGAQELLTPLSADLAHLRSNDGRADPWGGFWIGTMGKRAEERAGAIWRYWRGELRELFPGLSIPNAICFDAAREIAFFADTRPGTVWQQRLDPATGWPVGSPDVFLEMRQTEGNSPDGAVIDAEGRFWTAQWGAGRVACYDGRDGRFLGAESFGAVRTSCPAFGGEGLSTLFVTTAQQGMDALARAAEPLAGMTFARAIAAKGVAEPQVVL